jgi:hypothetical protein
MKKLLLIISCTFITHQIMAQPALDSLIQVAMQKSVDYYIKSNYTKADSNKIIVLTGRFSGYLRKRVLKYDNIHIWVYPHLDSAQVVFKDKQEKSKTNIGDFLELDFDMGKSECTWHCGINIFKSTTYGNEKPLSVEEKEALKKKGSHSSFVFNTRLTKIDSERQKMGIRIK